MVKESRFREDLYYRLHVIPLRIPSLRERREDIGPLARHFLNKYAMLCGIKVRGITRDAIEKLENYRWPGNVRELENCMEYAVNLSDASEITVSCLPVTLHGEEGWGAGSTLKERVRAFERRELIETTDRFGRDLAGKKQAALALGIGLRTLYRKLGELGLEQAG